NVGREGERRVTQTAAAIDYVVSRLGCDPNTVAIEVVLTAEKCRGDARGAALNPDLASFVGDGKNRQRTTEHTNVARLVHLPFGGNSAPTSFVREPYVCVSQKAVQNQLIE